MCLQMVGSASGICERAATCVSVLWRMVCKVAAVLSSHVRIEGQPKVIDCRGGGRRSPHCGRDALAHEVRCLR